MNFLNRFWPWKTINRLRLELAERDRQLALLKGCYEASQHQLESAKEKIVEHEGHFRKLTRIIAVSAGFGMIVLTCLSQPINRQMMTTNASVYTPQFTAPGGVVQFSNTAGALISVPHFGSVGPTTTQTNALIFNDRIIGGTATGIGSSPVFDFFRFISDTNIADQGNFYIGANFAVSDGSFVILQEVEGAVNISPRQWWTNTALSDVLIIGHPFGWGLIKTNATHNQLGIGAIDSTVINSGGLRFLKLVSFSTIQAANGCMNGLTNADQSTLLGAFIQGLLASTNDTMLGTAGNSWNSVSIDNTFLGASQIPNATHGNTNIIIGAELDLPVDGVDRQLNIGNLIWGTDLNAIANTPANGVMRLNGTFNIQSTTNQIQYGATNVAPGNTATPTKWINVKINGEATQYKMPLYQ